MFRATLRFDQGSAKPQLWVCNVRASNQTTPNPLWNLDSIIILNMWATIPYNCSTYPLNIPHRTFRFGCACLPLLLGFVSEIAQKTRGAGSNGGYPNKQETCKAWRDHRYLYLNPKGCSWTHNSFKKKGRRLTPFGFCSHRIHVWYIYLRLL